MAVDDAHVLHSFLTLALTQPFFFSPKPPTTFLTCFRDEENVSEKVRFLSLNEKRKHAGKL